MKTTLNWIQQADIALKRASLRARELAEHTQTPLMVRKDGKTVKLNRDDSTTTMLDSAIAPVGKRDGDGA